MRRIWRLVLCVPLLLATTLTVMGQSASDIRNGYWWQSCPEGMKVGYVIGYVEGSAASSTVWGLESNIVRKMYDTTNHASDKKMSQLASSFSDISVKEEDFSEIRFGQYVTGLDAFYRDFRNMSIHIQDAMPYVRDQIKGADNKELETELDMLRKASTSPGYDQ